MKLDHAFRDPELLDRALTHGSWAAEHHGGHYETLEFLGDSVLQLLVTDLLLRRHPDWDQGLLSKARQKVVCEPALATLAAELELGPAIRLGRGEAADRARGGDKPRILADALEAVLGALYLDGGLDAVTGAVGERLDDRIAALRPEDLLDAKSRLQQWAQSRGGGLPRYAAPETTGPPNALRFAVWVEVDGARFGPGEGTTKAEAEQAAARVALAELGPRAGA